ncbi:type II toxin-antitoxin system Rv0910 family toxin [Streptomyces clavuligerus]|nr:SRPBCC family protein [Streptomyces clavuligerus]MBY6305961.1 SRPBCC family protein [Streptomyces clavuligerus]QPL65831.1 SRPBCC family protein [Streptomyces clavuligerus]QPL72065.1 SRPBCC family protein [Streptomyces clavuligerus]QPL77944.1 SRPBCC family protein [Streptomyces clavuligerus]QPL83969.1 SRPBCC family protein [Streptomyces clavuligerus]
MAEVSAEARIAAPAAEIWAQLTDFSGHHRWSSTHTGFPGGGPATLESGARYQENMRLMGFPAEVTWTVVEYEPGRLLGITGQGPMGVTLRNRYALIPDGDTTVVRIEGEFTGAAVSLMAAKLTQSATAALEESLRRLAALPELTR